MSFQQILALDLSKFSMLSCKGGIFTVVFKLIFLVISDIEKIFILLLTIVELPLKTVL